MNSRYQVLKESVIGNTGVRLLLVEGIDDVAFFTNLFERLYAIDFLAENNTVLIDAGSKRNIITFLKEEPTWLGIIDRDEWRNIDLLRENHPNLHILPRFCVENYLCNPNELSVTLSSISPLGLTDDDSQAICNAILIHLPMYLKHAALWHTLFPMREQLLTELEFVEFFDNPVFPGDETIEERFRSWSDLIDHNRIMETYRSCIATFSSSGLADQYNIYIHGKRFWERILYIILREPFKKLNHGKYIKEAQLKIRLFQHMFLPDDIKTFADSIASSL